jgi:hypothetical protein
MVVLVQFWTQVDLHLGPPQGSKVLLHISLADVASGHQEPDHEGRVEHLAEPEGLGDVQRNAPHGGRRDLPVEQGIQAFIRRALESQPDLIRFDHGLQGLQGGEVAPGVVADPDRHPGKVLRAADR